MVQIGLNAGPQHARVSGFAVSYTKALDNRAKQLHDEDVIGAVSLVWQLIKTVSPSEITEHVEKKLTEEGLPSIAIPNVAEGTSSSISTCIYNSHTILGMGFKICLEDKIYQFPFADRGPPESYLSSGYVS